MTPRETEKFEKILALIDDAVGGPEETDEEHAARVDMIRRNTERRRIHRAG